MKENLREASQALKGLSLSATADRLSTDKSSCPLSTETFESELLGIELPFPMPEYCGDFQMRILRDGTWLYQNSPIGRKNLCRLFATVLYRDAQDQYWLITPAERGKITVDIAPFTFVEYRYVGAWLEMRSNLDDWVRLDHEHPLTMKVTKTGESLPFLMLRKNLPGLIVRSLFYQLVDLATLRVDQNAWHELSLRSGDLEFSLGCFDGSEL